MGGRHCMKAWRAGCGESRTSGSEGGPEKPAGGNVRTALRSDPYTYIPMARGFGYLVAIIDLFSRLVLAWRLSNSLETSFCVEALQEALERYGGAEIFNTDQGRQFTSEEFTGVLLERDIKISMDGRGRCLDNVFAERLWRSLKYEEVYLYAYDTLSAAREGIGCYFDFFNNERPHSALGRCGCSSHVRGARASGCRKRFDGVWTNGFLSTQRLARRSRSHGLSQTRSARLSISCSPRSATGLGGAGGVVDETPMGSTHHTEDSVHLCSAVFVRSDCPEAPFGRLRKISTR